MFRIYWTRPWYRITPKDDGFIVPSAIVTWGKREISFRQEERNGGYVRVPDAFSYFLAFDFWIVKFNFYWKSKPYEEKRSEVSDPLE